MKCVDCKNKTYCESFKALNMYGCTTGIPKYLPSLVADDIVYKIRAGSSVLSIDQDQYLKDILDEVYSKLKK